jgi:hypothetical protein
MPITFERMLSDNFNSSVIVVANNLLGDILPSLALSLPTGAQSASATQ